MVHAQRFSLLFRFPANSADVFVPFSCSLGLLRPICSSKVAIPSTEHYVARTAIELSEAIRVAKLSLGAFYQGPATRKRFSAGGTFDRELLSAVVHGTLETTESPADCRTVT